MARPLRLQYPGALYHVISRGNYRAPVFGEEGSKEAFLECLFAACAKANWRLHGYVVMSNHYHLALETPDGNLSAGMRWLQSTYANRFNRYRDERGHVFQGRYKAILVEDLTGLGAVAHYIHLNPVRAKLLPVERLAEYRESSYWMLQHPKVRSAYLDATTCLQAAGERADRAASRRRYGQYLSWLMEDGPAQKQLKFDRMSKGWAHGSVTFKKALVKDHRAAFSQGSADLENREAMELIWAELVNEALKRLAKKPADIVRDSKGADWKAAIAAHLKATTTATNPWLAAQLHMGVAAGVSRYVGEVQTGQRPAAHKLLTKLRK